MTPLDIDDLLRETESTSFPLTPTTDETHDLDDDLKSLDVFKEECERRLSNLTEEQGPKTEGKDEGGDTVPEGLHCARDAEAEDSLSLRTGNDGKPGEGSDGEGREEGRRGDGEEEEEEEEGMKMAQKSLQEVCSDLSTLRTPSSEGRSVRPKTKLYARKSNESQYSNASDTFGGGQQVEKPRPRVTSTINYTVDNLERELTNLLEMFGEKELPKRDDVDNSETTTTTTTANTTTTTTNMRPRSTPHFTSRTTPPSYSRTSLTSLTTPSTTSSENLYFTFPSSPTSDSSINLPSPAQQRDERRDSDLFSTLKEGVKHLGWRNSLKRKKKKHGKKGLVIGEPQDFRTLTATTSIKPDADPMVQAVPGDIAGHGAG